MSLAVAVAGRNRVVVSSDDRSSNKDSSWQDRKVALFDAGQLTLVGISGILDCPRGKFAQTCFSAFRKVVTLLPTRYFFGLFHKYVPDDVARLCSDEGLRDRPRELLEAIRDYLHEPLRIAFQRDPDHFRWLLPDQKVIFQAFCVRRRAGGQVDLLQLMFPISEVDGRAVLHEPEIDVIVDAVPGSRGPVYCVGGLDSKLPAVPPNTNDPDDQILAGMDRLYEIASAQDDTIGVPSHIAVIEEAGVRWLRSGST